MTTTNVFQGLGEGAKNSSRVLAPPGGGSSFSFGGPSAGDTPAPPKKTAPRPKENASPIGSAAGLPLSQKPKETAERLHTGHVKPGGNLKNKDVLNPITGLPIIRKGIKENIDPISNEGTFNPLTCEDYGKVKTCEFELPPEPPAKPIHTSTKVKEPPGGRSSICFF